MCIMINNKITEKYLFAKHSINTIKRWNKNLYYGFYKRAEGGFSDDGDEFGIWLNYKNESELFEILNVFKIELKIIPKKYPKPIIGKQYSWTEYEKFKCEIKDYPVYEQPLNIKINEIPCFCWIENGKISLKFSGALDGNHYEVNERDFENCSQIEKIISKNDLGKFVSFDYENWTTHISQKNYPELFD